MPKVSLPRAMASGVMACLGMTFSGWIVGLVAEEQSKEEHTRIIVFEVEPTDAIKNHVFFSHQDHLEEYGYECKDCHNGRVFAKEQKMGINKFIMKDINRGRACGACHDGTTKAKNGDRIFGPTKNCTRCHSVKWHKTNSP